MSSRFRVLYHFTTAHAIDRIRVEGLTKGVLPWNRAKDGTPQLLRNMKGAGLPGPGFQWLTKNPEFAQPFALLGSLPVPRNAYRITIVVPDKMQGLLFEWPELCRRGRPDCAEELNVPAVDWQNWFVYHGRIPRTWFVAVERNVRELLTPDQAFNIDPR